MSYHSLEVFCSEYNKEIKESGKIIDFSSYLTLREKIIGNMTEFRNIAARGDNPKLLKKNS